jgi:CRISPR-associated protein Cas2
VTVVVTRNVPDRYHGFLASCLLELAPGVYAGPALSAAVRDRVWAVCCEWAGALPDEAGVLMTWPDASAPGGQALRLLGWPKREFVELDGTWLVAAPGSVTTE